MKSWIVGFAVFLLVFYVYTLFNGTPWGKEAMKKKSTEYLRKKYGDEMQIDSVVYDFDNSSFFKYRYFTVVHLKGNPQIQFRVVENGKDLVDNYYLSYWEYEVKNEIMRKFPQISDLLFQIRSNPLQNYSEGNRNYPPSYHDIKKEFKDDDFSELRLWLNTNEEVQDSKLRTLLEIVLFLKEKDYRVSTIKFYFVNHTNKVSFYLNGADLKDIIDIESLNSKFG